MTTSVCAQTQQHHVDDNFYTSADLGLGIIDAELFGLILLEQGFLWPSFELVLNVPLRFSLGKNAKNENGTLRNADWDNRSDYSKIIRKLRYYKEFNEGEFELFAGELNGFHIGHRTIISHYYNSLDMDNYHGGLFIHPSFAGGGFEFLMNDFLAPGFFTTRVYVHPMRLFTQQDWSKRFEIGTTFFIDRGVAGRVLSTQRNRLFIYSLDSSLKFIDFDSFASSLYLDVGISNKSAGIHTGLGFSLAGGKNKNLLFDFTAEYRFAGEKYFPALVNPFYDHNRRFYSEDPLTEEQNTFAEHLSNRQMDFNSAHGFALDLSFTASDVFRFSTRYDFMGNKRPHWLLFKLEIYPSPKNALSFFFAGQDIFGGSRIFSSNSIIGLSYHNQLVGPLRTFTEYVRRYRHIDDNTWKTANELSFGLGLFFSY